MRTRIWISLIFVILLFSIGYYAYAQTYRGSKICGVSYNCAWTKDGVCPEDYGASCRYLDYCDQDCPNTECHKADDCDSSKCGTAAAPTGSGDYRYYKGNCNTNCQCYFGNSEDCSGIDSVDSEGLDQCDTDTAYKTYGTVKDYTTCNTVSGVATCVYNEYKDTCDATTNKLTEYCVKNTNKKGYDTYTKDCNVYDVWTQCTVEKKSTREYHEYSCPATEGKCTYKVTKNQPCVSISSIDAPSSVDAGSLFTVKCGSSYGPVNCISASVGGRDCTWDGTAGPNGNGWDGDNAIFKCTATSTCPTTETVKCFVDESKCYALSPKEKTQDVIVTCSTCGGYTTKTACEADSKCDWCQDCEHDYSGYTNSNRYWNEPDKCMDAGTCDKGTSDYYCYKDKCDAKCDNTRGGFGDKCGTVAAPTGSGDYRYYDGSCTDNCLVSYASSEDCSAKDSTDSDGGLVYTTAGTVTDYITCLNGACTYNTYSDYCSDTKVYEYEASGASYNGPKEKECQDYEGYVCSGNDRYRQEWGCCSGRCADACVSDTFEEDCTAGYPKCDTDGITRYYDAKCDSGTGACTYSTEICKDSCSDGVCVANRLPTLNSVAASPYYVRQGDVISVASSASDPDSQKIRLECGSSSGSGNLCISSSYVDSNPSCSFTSSWTDNVEHIIYCRVRDNGSPAAISSEKTTSIKADNRVDSVSVSHSPSGPIADAGSTASVTITATASDSGSGLAFINVFVDGNFKKLCETSPCTYTDNYDIGTYQYYAIANDNLDNKKTSSTGSFEVAACGPGYECVTRNSKTCRYSNSGSYEWVIDLGAETACSDGKDNDCDSKTDRLDPTDCGVEVISIDVSNPCPAEGIDVIDVGCTSSVPNVNCIGAYVDYNGNGIRDAGENCLWNNQSRWEGSKAVFDSCSPGSSTTPQVCNADEKGRKVECYIQTDKCSQLGTSKSTTIDVINDPCPNHVSENTCTNDPKCKWVEACSGVKFYAYTDKPNGACVRSGTTVGYYCTNGKCGATCDGSDGCPAYMSGDTCYYSGVCDVATTCSCSYSSEKCPNAGTVIGTTCYYGARSCTGSGCGLNTCTLTGVQVCHITKGCIKPSAEEYEAVFEIRIPNKKDMYYKGEHFEVRVKAFLRERATSDIVYYCNFDGVQNDICRIKSITIDTATAKKNYITETGWNYMHPNNFDPIKNEWMFAMDTNLYRSKINVTGDIGDIEGSDEETYGVEEPSELTITINYPDVDNYIVPLTPTGKPNFTMTMPIRFFAKVKKNSLVSPICESPDCTATYGIDELPTTPMIWDAYEKKFYASHDSTTIPLDECDIYHTITVEAIDTVYDITKTEQSNFFLSCTPRITASPVERRVVLGDTNLIAFNVTAWNPKEATRFDIVMTNLKPDDVFVLNWLSFDCLGQIGCTASDDAVSLFVNRISSKSAVVRLLSADRSGSYPLVFTGTREGKTYKAIAHLLVFSEALSEFSIVYLFALFVIAIAIFAFNKDSFGVRKR